MLLVGTGAAQCRDRYGGDLALSDAYLVAALAVIIFGGGWVVVVGLAWIALA